MKQEEDKRQRGQKCEKLGTFSEDSSNDRGNGSFGDFVEDGLERQKEARSDHRRLNVPFEEFIIFTGEFEAEAADLQF